MSTVSVCKLSVFDVTGKVTELIRSLQCYVDTYGDEVCLDLEVVFHDVMDAVVVGELYRPETNEERAFRLGKPRKQDEEYELYLKLKAKYGDK